MALQSPGVQVTVIDESFYTPAEPGTTPLIVVATAQDKTNSGGTGIASATTQANAGKAFKLTSQKDLLDLYGVPFFEKTASSSPIHGGERNEYGLLAAYSLLGVSNAAFLVRADVDLAQLEATANAPGANPNDGAWWINTTGTTWGIQEWNSAAVSTTGGQKFANKTPIVLTDADSAKIENGLPKESVGNVGDYAIVFQTVQVTDAASSEAAKLYYKSAGNTEAGVDPGQWVLVGSTDWKASHPSIVGPVTGTVGTLTNADTFYINGTLVNNIGTSLASLVTKINTLNIGGAGVITAKAVNGKLYLYNNGTGGTGSADGIIEIAAGTGTVLADIGIGAGKYWAPALQMTPHSNVPEWKRGEVIGGFTATYGRPTGSVWIKTTEPNLGARWRANKWSSATSSWVSSEAPLYAFGHEANFYLDRSGGGLNIDKDYLYVQTNSDEESGVDTTPATAKFRVWKRNTKGATSITTTIEDNSLTTGSNTVAIRLSIKGSAELTAPTTVTFTAATGVGSGTTNAERIATAINSAVFYDRVEPTPNAIEGHIVAGVSGANGNVLTITHSFGGEIRFDDGTNSPIAAIFTPYAYNASSNVFTGDANFYALPTAALGDSTIAGEYLASNWRPLAADGFAASDSAPENEPQDGQLWYNPEFSEVDLMVHNGKIWCGYNYVYTNADPAGPQVTASMPTAQSDGTALVTGDIWISTADIENFPTIYRYNSDVQGAASEKWVLVDKTDQTTEDGVLFADARYGLSGATGNTAADIADLLTSNYVDPDSPDAALYPKGMLLWNLRRSGGNVKKYVNSYIDVTADNERYNSTYNEVGQYPLTGNSMASYTEVDRWVTASPNAEDGSGSFGRKAQRSVIVAAMKSVVDTSSEIRDEERRNFNIIAAPGYPELMSNLVNLNIDRGITSFVIGDTPLRLPADATSLTNWGSNAELVTDNGDNGIVTYDEYLGVFYPNGFTTDLGGSNAVVPASHMMLKTIALSDNVSYPWFAPAGTRRGGITNATAVGYIDSLSGEFQTVALNNGQRDTLYDLKINPITFFNGVGLVNYGQKTRARNASALDRINVARLTVYLRSQLNKLARPYVFEPNDKITRDEIKQAVESLLLELVGLRALYDFAVVCDETNNTAARIDRNELWVDIAIEPVKAVEFIYIPLRVKNTGEI
jgi:hypothetical protein